MKILSFERNGGDLRATILCEASDRGRFGGVRETVEGCIRLFAEEKGLPQPALPRVTRMDETADGGLEFDFDAAVPPVVELGQYLGLEVYVPSDEAPDLHVLRAAAERMKVEIPETYISRKTDGLMGQRLEDVAQRTGFVTLADMAAILRRVDAALALGRSDDELWDAAVAAADEMSGAQLRAHSVAETVEIIAAALFGEGAKDRDGAIENALRQRAEEKQRTNPKTLAEECFACYLRHRRHVRHAPRRGAAARRSGRAARPAAARQGARDDRGQRQKDIKEKNGIRPEGRMPFSLLCFMPGTPERLCAPRRASCG